MLNNGSFLAMNTGTRVYYEFPSDLPEGVVVEPFPKDFRMGESWPRLVCDGL